MTAEFGHAPNRVYTDHGGNFHVNGAQFLNDNEVDVSDQLNAAGIKGGTTCAGGVLAIPTTHRYVAKTTGGAEALTLANGTPGQKLTVALVSDGGDGTITPATKSGFATVVLADVKDNVTFEYVDDTIGWIIVGAAGVLAPPVIS